MVRAGQRVESRHFRRGPDGWGWTGDTTTAEATKDAEAEVVVTVPSDSGLDLSTVTKAELVEMAEAKGVDTSGTKADIAARL